MEPTKTQSPIEPALILIRKWESFYSNAYLDPVGIPTIGWGTIEYPDGTKVKMGDVCTKDQANEWLMFEVNKKSKAIEDMVKVSIPNTAFCALLSFGYNVGVEEEGLKGSTLMKKLNRGDDPHDVAKEFDKWIFAKGKKLAGLVNRRADEKALFLSDYPKKKEEDSGTHFGDYS